MVGIVALGALSACGTGTGQPPDDQSQEMVGWLQRNPPVSETTWRGVSKLQCKPKNLDICGPTSCRSKQFDDKAAPPPVLLRWMPAEKTFQRCDADGGACDTYHPVVSYSGSFANIVDPEHALLFRLTASGEYREITSLGNETYVYRGQCAQAE